MQIRSKYDVTIFAWPKEPREEQEEDEEKDEHEEEEEKEEKEGVMDAAEEEILQEALDRPAPFSMFSSSPALQEFLTRGSVAALRRRGRQPRRKQKGGEGEEEEEGAMDADFPDLRDVPFSISSIVWNYIDQTRTTAHSIKRSKLEQIFQQKMEFTFKRWTRIEEQVVDSVIQTFRDLPGDHGVYTLNWNLKPKFHGHDRFSMQVLENGQEVSSMCSFRSIDDWPRDVVWFRVILDLDLDDDHQHVFSFRTCSFNFLVSRQEKQVFGWTCADIPKAAHFRSFADFFTQEAFVPILKVVDPLTTSFSDWTFLICESFHPIMRANLLVSDIHRQASPSARPVIEAALELAVDVRMIHSLIQTNGFRTSFRSRPTPYLKSFLQSSLSTRKKLSADKVWKSVLHLGTSQQRGVSLPVYTIFLYLACSGVDSSTRELAQQQQQQQEDRVRTLIAHQLDVANSWNQPNDENVLLSLQVSEAPSFLLALLDEDKDEILQEFSAEDAALEEKLRVLFPTMFFVNELGLVYRKLVEMEAELRLSAKTTFQKNKWYFFLFPVLICRKPTLDAPSESFWNDYGLGAFYVLIGKMTMNADGGGGETQADSSYAMLNFFPFEPEDDRCYSAWQKFTDQESMEMLFPMQTEVVSAEESAATTSSSPEQDEEDEEDASLDDHLIECLDRSFRAVEFNQDLVSPGGFATIIEEREETEFMQAVK